MPIEALRALLQHSQIGQARSSVLNPLQWMLVILVGGIISARLAQAPEWVTLMLGGLIVVVAILACAFYAYFALTNPDALRSEHYSLSKLAIEHGLIGDSLTGMAERSQTPAGPTEPIITITKRLSTSEDNE